MESDKSGRFESVEGPRLGSEGGVVKSLATQSSGQESLSAGGHAALAGQVPARGFPGSGGSRSGSRVAQVRLLVLRGPDFSALSPPSELGRSRVFGVQRGPGVLMVVAVFSGALRPARPPQDARSGEGGVADGGWVQLAAPAALLGASPLGAGPLRQRWDLAKRRVGPLHLDALVSVRPGCVGLGQGGRGYRCALTVRPAGVEQAGVSGVRLAPRVGYVSVPRAGGRGQAVGGGHRRGGNRLAPGFAALLDWNVRGSSVTFRIVKAAVVSAEPPADGREAARRAVVVV